MSKGLNLGPRRRARGVTPEERYDTLAGRVMTVKDIRRDLGLEVDEIERNMCRVCGEEIRMQIRRWTGLCSARCEDAEIAERQAMADYATEASEREPT